MNLTHACIVTRDFDGMLDFYTRVLGSEPTRFDAYAEFATDGAVLALCGSEMMETILPGQMRAGANASLQVELEVKAVDDEFKRLTELGIPSLNEPTDYPWGNRAFYFRDPEGNVLSFFARKG